jgi:hypothetical protein
MEEVDGCAVTIYLSRTRATKSNDGSIPPVPVALRLPLAKKRTQKERGKEKKKKTGKMEHLYVVLYNFIILYIDLMTKSDRRR